VETKVINIYGAGPAGSSLAYYLKSSPHDVNLFEAMSRPGMKPCGWAVPYQLKEYVPIPQDTVLTEVYNVKVYLDNVLLLDEETRTPWGYILDKPKWLEIVLEGTPIQYLKKKPVIPYDNPRENEINVIAAGHHWKGAPRERINALQILIDDLSWKENSTIEFWFDRNMVGYYWVFPRGNNKVDVGVGGFMKFNELRIKLLEFIERQDRFSSGKKKELRGASIVITGLQERLLELGNNWYVIGEAAGAVYPLTGEGIRPSIITSKALYNSINNGTSYKQEIEKTGLFFSMRIHRALLEILLKATPEERVKLMKSIPRKWLMDFALGSFSLEKIMKNIALFGPYFKAFFKLFQTISTENKK